MGCVGSKQPAAVKVVESQAEPADYHAEPSQRVEDDTQTPLPPRMSYANRDRRGSVSAEVGALPENTIETRITPKTPRTEDNILKALQHCFLFRELDDKQTRDVVAAMFERPARKGDIILREGDAGDNLYVIQAGTFEAVKGPSKRVLFTYEGAGAFGELALMYNCSRAATVRAVTDGMLWAMDRGTFRTIVLASRVQQRARFEKVLEDVAIFQSLSPANRSSIADCLTTETYQEGECILREGEPLTTESKFYIIEAGTVECWKLFEGERRLVGCMGPGRFFGEMALVQQNAGRAADCVAATKARVLTLGRDAFERLMGPAENILAEQVAVYERTNRGLSFNATRNPRRSYL